MNLDVFTCLANNSAPYAEALLKNLMQTASGANNIRFWALAAKKDAEHIGYPKGWVIIPVNTDKVHPVGVSKPSMNHAKLLNQIEYHIPDDSHVVIITDCDMFVFLRKWDNFLIRKLQELDCIGTEKHDGSLRMFFIAFRPDAYTKLAPDYTPGVNNLYESCWTKNISGRMVVADTGWKLEDMLGLDGLRYEKLAYVDGSTCSKYFSKGGLFCSHLGGSHRKDFKSKEVKGWYKECNKLIYN